MPSPEPHKWVPSTLGHGETMCEVCFMTNREAAALGQFNECPGPGPGPIEGEIKDDDDA